MFFTRLQAGVKWWLAKLLIKERKIAGLSRAHKSCNLYKVDDQSLCSQKCGRTLLVSSFGQGGNNVLFPEFPSY